MSVLDEYYREQEHFFKRTGCYSAWDMNHDGMTAYYAHETLAELPRPRDHGAGEAIEAALERQEKDAWWEEHGREWREDVLRQYGPEYEVRFLLPGMAKARRR